MQLTRRTVIRSRSYAAQAVRATQASDGVRPKQAAHRICSPAARVMAGQSRLSRMARRMSSLLRSSNYDRRKLSCAERSIKPKPMLCDQSSSASQRLRRPQPLLLVVFLLRRANQEMTQAIAKSVPTVSHRGRIPPTGPRLRVELRSERSACHHDTSRYPDNHSNCIGRR